MLRPEAEISSAVGGGGADFFEWFFRLFFFLLLCDGFLDARRDTPGAICNVSWFGMGVIVSLYVVVSA